jgi:hypothetical protein
MTRRTIMNMIASGAATLSGSKALCADPQTDPALGALQDSSKQAKNSARPLLDLPL